MTFEELKEKALSLPFAPGVYIMRDKNDKVIYVGKAKKLKNRVSQYFQDTASHTPKTRLMVSKIHHFDVIVAASEFEALVLECSLIKRYLPKYNILLKDDKGYPYLRLNMKDIYPKITRVSKISDDGAQYYGPFGSRGVTHDVMEAVQHTLKLPTCGKEFPRDVGKERPCLNYHMNQCAGWCQTNKSCIEYREIMEQAERRYGEDTPLLVHSDCRLVDAQGVPLAESFFRRQGWDPAATSLARLLVQNNVTGCTLMMNAPLRRLALQYGRPSEMYMHDWFLALTAAAFGQIVFIPEPLVSYRQHGSNVMGASASGQVLRGAQALSQWEKARARITLTYDHAQAFRDMYGEALPDAARLCIDTYLSTRKLCKLRRVLAVRRGG